MKALPLLNHLTISAVAAIALLTSSCCTTKKTEATANNGNGKESVPEENDPSQPTKPSHPPESSALCNLKDDEGQAIPTNFTGTLGTTQQSHAANHVVEIQKVESACCTNFDRLVFAVDGIHQPTYTIQYAQPPFTDCGSGNAHNVPGNAWLTIKMTPAQGHGTVTLPREQAYQCVNLKHLSITCDFESDLTFVVGVNTKKPYRVIELQNPTRLVLDIKH